jgi:hypothetical protein
VSAVSTYGSIKDEGFSDQISDTNHLKNDSCPLSHLLKSQCT